MTTSPSLKPSKSLKPSAWHRLATRLWWVSMTPLGSPVVPLEYGSTTTSSRGLIFTEGGLGGASNSSAKGRAPSAVPKT